MLDKNVRTQYEIEGLGVHHLLPMGYIPGAHSYLLHYLHLTVPAAVHHMSVPHPYSSSRHGVHQAPTR